MNHTKAIFFGIVMWIFSFIVSVLIFPLHEAERALFESIMPVSLVLSTTWLSVLYIRTLSKRIVWRSFCLGLIFMAVNLILDFLVFSWGPMKMQFDVYLKDIGVTYLLIPIIPTGIGFLLEEKGKHR